MSNLNFFKVSDLPVIHIQNFYSSEEYKLIMKELEFLNGIDRFKNPEEPGGPGTAYVDGKPLKVGKGLHLNAVYDDPRQSDILHINRKLFDQNLMDYHPFFRYVWRSNKDETKIHYFTNGDHYKSHTDDCVVTAITWFYKEPKIFTGGDLILENKVKLPCLNNSIAIFPSILYHEVTEVMMDNLPGMGRYSMSQFLYM
ncbi:2OG-Fe(II) oxygenase family like protein [Synechococcus phage S-RSM4]|uniref:2OG-Fe(II) oxygenase family like protein n=1 Tax=Synechococcus phage S-RSM4 TaxID=555387 RepID=C7BVA4_9CAUD|nr:2OG-Fe(II) oxygenase family like protein [Synechococcus phage S-RSM4]CAR63333.1 2OG-Fe(II) oxygenase family like protein [Synechococcus phage S-RSM4]